MALARFAIMIELNEDGKVRIKAENNDLTAETVIMRLRAFVRDMERDYFKSASESTTSINPPK